MTYRKRFAALGMSLVLTASFFTGCNVKKSLPSLKSEEKESEIQSEFDTYTDELFEEEVTLNTIALHYTLADPAAYGINDYEISLGSVTDESLSESVTMLENMRSSLDDFSYPALRDDQQLTYDILDDYSKLELDNAKLYLYSEVLQPSTGTHTQLPVLLAEYTFRCEKDVTDYLELLSLLPSYFDEIIQFEKSKANAGLFMSKQNADTVISQCQDFIENPKSCFLIETFDNRIESLSTLSTSAKEEYRSQNETYVLKKIIPAYKNLAAAIEELKDSGSNKGGLCNYEDGKDYYEYLVRYSTGSSDSIKDLQKQVEQKRKEDLLQLSELLTKNPILAKESESYQLDTSDPSQILAQLKETIKKDFPEAPDANFTVKYVDEALEDYLSPAFYLTSPIDDYKENSIYINEGSHYEKMKLFTTLAHEGFPGHMYQYAYMYENVGSNYIKALSNISAYTEGYAVYAQYEALSYLDGVDQTLLEAYKENELATYCMIILADIGIHYDGWSVEEFKEFMESKGFSLDDASIQTQYAQLQANPAAFEPYYVGYHEIINMKEDAQQVLGSRFHEKEFHTALLESGIAPFQVVQQHIDAYVEKNK